MIIKDKIYINTKELGTNIQELCSLFTYDNPEFYQKKKLKLSTGSVLDTLYHYRTERIDKENFLLLPRGGVEKVRKFYEDHKLPFRIKDDRISHEKIDVKLIKTKIEGQQKLIIDTLIKNEGGLIESQPGSGKTIACLGFIAKIKQPTLIFVHEHRLSSQWKQEINKRLSGNFTLGEINGDVKKDGDIVIGIINSLYNLFQNDPSYFNKFGAIVVDETHKLPANMFMSVINNINAKYRVGVTGTVDRKDGKEILLFDVIGPKLLSIQASQIKHRIMPFEYVMVNTNTPLRIPTVSRWTGRSREDVLDITSCITKLTESDERNSVIISKAMEVIDSGYFPLILSDRVDHNKKMYNHLKELGYNVALLIGETRKKTNWEDIRNDETIQCIVANTAIASEALDLPRLSSVFFTTVSSNYPKIAQRIGRIRRFVEGKILPLVVDFVDNLAYMDTDKGKKYILKHMATKRIKFYEKLKSDYNNYDGDCFEGS